MRYYCFLDPKGEFSPDQFDPVPTDWFAIADEEGSSSWYIPIRNDEEAAVFAREHGLGEFSPVELQECIDWGMQWSLGEEERLEIDLSKLCSHLVEPAHLTLIPGPGFGDLSHPTTRLMVGMMGSYAPGRVIWDIGCGSGILSLAALKLGAVFAYGIDIDAAAVEHAKLNAEENALSDQVKFWVPEADCELEQEMQADAIVLMNMIRSEQETVWQSLPALHTFQGTVITSGVLQEEVALYRKWCEERGWKVEEERVDGDWMAFRLHRERLV